MQETQLPWIHPLRAAQRLTQGESCWALLYSGQQTSYSGRYSYVCLLPQEIIQGDSFAPLADKLGSHSAPHRNAWFGYLGYELLHGLENLPRESQHYIALPDLWFARFGVILQFDHESKRVTCFHEDSVSPPQWNTDDTDRPLAAMPAICALGSPMTRHAYLQQVAQTRDAIANGDFYQANITRKFTGEFAEPADALSVFQQLCEASPGVYSAVLKMGDSAVISSSPERFMTIGADGEMESRPIKGTAPRMADAVADKDMRSRLAGSEKDRAENLMIVDLMRNDMARSAVAGSVTVEGLFDVSSYATLHHMASTVRARKRDDVATLDAIRDCFPPGSMTGAPKIRAMQWCLKREGIRRGVYSGALGWFAGDGSCDLSVVIRTLVVQATRFEFQVGGGIVADSDPESEWQETMTKARGICKALGIPTGTLEEI